MKLIISKKLVNIIYLTLFVSVWDNLNDTTFKQRGATPHYELIVREWLQEVFAEKWIVEVACAKS